MSSESPTSTQMKEELNKQVSKNKSMPSRQRHSVNNIIGKGSVKKSINISNSDKDLNTDLRQIEEKAKFYEPQTLADR